ncbi:MAG TPA: hypothetical protein VKI44_15195 [Acetobacteraceae bacterium]|nr:hypothetical protein [Acetobacteraceae bacterium]
MSKVGALPDEIEADRYLHDLDARYPGLPASSRSEKTRFGRALFSDGCPVVVCATTGGVKLRTMLYEKSAQGIGHARARNQTQ